MHFANQATSPPEKRLVKAAKSRKGRMPPIQSGGGTFTGIWLRLRSASRILANHSGKQNKPKKKKESLFHLKWVNVWGRKLADPKEMGVSFSH